MLIIDSSKPMITWPDDRPHQPGCCQRSRATAGRAFQVLFAAAMSTACGEPTGSTSVADDARPDADAPPAAKVAGSGRAEPVPTPGVPTPTPTPTPAVAVPEREWKSPTLGVMKWIPAGSYTMGSPTSEVGRYKDETPHPVTLTRGWWMMEREVTQGAWSAVMGSNPSSSASCGADCPVEMVSWEDAQTFAKHAGARDGATYRLATEAEWEWAARGGQTHVFAGSDTAETVGWVLGTSAGRSHPACGLARNGYGLCDMTGNVAEWVGDWYGQYDTAAATDPVGPQSGQWRVLRGGTWGADPRNIRVARRDETAPSARSPVIGFRLVRPVAPASAGP